MKKALLKLFAVLAIMSLVAAACGGSDDDEPDEAATAAETAPADDDTGDDDGGDDDGGDDSSGDDSSGDDSSGDDSGGDDSSGDDGSAECVTAQGVTDTEIKLGSSQPLTGNLAALGAQASLAIDATIKRINDGGGIHGRTISVVIQDDGFETEKAVANADFFVNREEVFGVWASIGSAPLVAAIPIHNEADVMTLFPWAQDPTLYDRDANPNFFILNPSGGAQALAFSDYLGNDFDYGDETPKVAVLSLNSPDGESAVQGFKDGAAGAWETASQTWERDATTYQPQLLAMADAGVTDVYTVVGDTQFAQIINEANQVGLEARFWGTNAVVTSGVVDLAGDLAEGALGVTVMAGLNEDGPGIAQFKAEMEAVGAEEADISSAALLAYAGGLVLEEGLQLAGPCLTNEALTEAFLSLDNFDTGGIMAPITFDPATGLGNQGAIVQQIIDGVWTRIN